MKRYIKSNITELVGDDTFYIVYLQENYLENNGYYREQYDDFGYNPVKVRVRSLDEASKTVRKYIDTFGLGASEFTGGRVENEAGDKVAEISYNGRIWLPGDKLYKDEI